jgi:transketolase
MRVEPLLEKWEAFGWLTQEVDGHDIKQLCDALDSTSGDNEKPRAIVANTIKGKGVSFLENTFKYHNYSLTREQYDQAVEELQAKINLYLR